MKFKEWVKSKKNILMLSLGLLSFVVLLFAYQNCGGGGGGGAASNTPSSLENDNPIAETGPEQTPDSPPDETTNGDEANSKENTPIPLENILVGFENNQNPKTVVGQDNFFDATLIGFTQKNFDNPRNIAVTNDGKMVIADTGSDRLLIYNSIPTTNGMDANLVIGQSNFNTKTIYSEPSQTEMHYPYKVYEAENKFIVVDQGFNRILIWNTVPTMNNTPADVVIGQEDFTKANNDCAANRLNGPSAATIVKGKLVVVDSENHRVLIWNKVPTGPNVNADFVLGQNSLDECIEHANKGNTNEYGLQNPLDVWSDGVKIYVADTDNNRVVGWNHFPTTIGDIPADFVIGKPNFTTGGGENMPAARALASNGKMLFISTGSRIWIWNDIEAAKTNLVADVTIGADTPESKGLSEANGVLIKGKNLFVTDTTNHRVLIYEGK